MINCAKLRTVIVNNYPGIALPEGRDECQWEKCDGSADSTIQGSSQGPTEKKVCLFPYIRFFYARHVVKGARFQWRSVTALFQGKNDTGVFPSVIRTRLCLYSSSKHPVCFNGGVRRV